MAAGPRWEEYYQRSQQQRQQQRQHAEQPQQQPSSTLRAEYVAARAAAPKLEELTTAELQKFIREVRQQVVLVLSTAPHLVPDLS